MAYDNRGRVSSVNDVFGQTVGYSYDANGNRTQLTVGGAANASYQYDVMNRLTQLADAANLSFVFAYDATNKLTSQTAPNGVTSTYQYDGLDSTNQIESREELLSSDAPHSRRLTFAACPINALWRCAKIRFQ